MRSIFQPKKLKSTNPSLSSLDLVSVSKSFKVGKTKMHVLKNVSLSIASGEIVALMGPSGCGKSTLAHIAGGIMKPDSGQVYIAGKSISRMRETKLAKVRQRLIGFVFQNFNLLNSHSVIDNVALPLTAAGVRPRLRQKAAADAMKRAQLSVPHSTPSNRLSGGERQRLAIARAIVHNPTLIIADEPTGSLDSKNGDAIMDLLVRLSKDKGIATLIVTHDEQIAKRADRVVHMNDGAVIAHREVK